MRGDAVIPYPTVVRGDPGHSRHVYQGCPPSAGMQSVTDIAASRYGRHSWVWSLCVESPSLRSYISRVIHHCGRPFGDGSGPTR